MRLPLRHLFSSHALLVLVPQDPPALGFSKPGGGGREGSSPPHTLLGLGSVASSVAIKQIRCSWQVLFYEKIFSMFELWKPVINY